MTVDDLIEQQHSRTVNSKGTTDSVNSIQSKDIVFELLHQQKRIKLPNGLSIVEEVEE